ncbi:NAD(P)/FAD-dependent oxidoreductase [Flavobacterium sp. NKUCC04_CG]|uniref:NAD(P)/FAD-dependent oxidoreductase n=1 Tax=Flavobacterium sp. NKUCC04_CG TaxID=2842121 RepID=UPI001C5B11B9|nr:NAD(P)/FAD-dependent oxidoreductase [Flavobacterium sp. NKUCC04_CG]MBW3519158.1 NAD(P)/FAD-dependent oxidoreductase [Flavobacterium sp. NKUCC04_CG]
MQENNLYEVIVVGGSYSGLSAALSLARSLRKVLIIDSNRPCNRQTPHSHNFLTRDGFAPAELASIARTQLLKYDTVQFKDDIAESATIIDFGFKLQTQTGNVFHTKKLIMATGLEDLLAEIPGVKESWGISTIHCPYCHGYEFKNQETGVFSNGTTGVGLVKLISNWSKKITLFTNGPSTLTYEEAQLLERNQIKVVETEIERFEEQNGLISEIRLRDGSSHSTAVVYMRPPVKQQSDIPLHLGAEFTPQGLLKVDESRQTTVPNLYACGDNSSHRSVASAVATGSLAGAMVNSSLIEAEFI